MNTGRVPTQWCTGIILPLYKNKGSHDDPNNYRGITLLSCLGKLFTNIINNRLAQYLEDDNILGEEQAGFRAGYSTLDDMFVLHCLVDIYQYQNKRVYCAFVDCKKTFDLIDRSSLWLKLITVGVKGKIFKVVYSMHAKAKSCVRKNGKFSQMFDCEIGVRQGENLSPLLFAIFLNDFKFHMSRHYAGIPVAPRYMEKSVDTEECVLLRLWVLLYADDTICHKMSYLRITLAIDIIDSVLFIEWRLLTTSFVVIYLCFRNTIFRLII